MILGKALNSLNVLKEHKTTYMYLKRGELKEHNYEKGDTEGVVNYGLSLKDIDTTKTLDILYTTYASTN